MAWTKLNLYRPFPKKVFESYVEVLPHLIDVARGVKKADLVIRNVDLVDVVSGGVVEGVSIAVYKGFVAGLTRVSRDSMYIGLGTEVIDGKGLYVAPGFIDAHVHVESSMLNPEEFSRVAVLHGVTLAVVDPHEVANVGGVDYVVKFARRASNQLLKMLIQIPCCVPPTNPELDNPGATITLKDIEDLISTDLFHSLGEVMDFQGVALAYSEVVQKILLAFKKGLHIYGHIPSKDETLLNIYTVTPVSSCHESTDVEEVLEKLRRGLWIMLRFSTAWREAENILPTLVSMGVDLSRVMLVTDDISVVDLVEKGYIDYVVKHMVELGVDPVKALKMVTVNPATYLRLDNVVGIVAPGRLADIVLLKDIERIDVDTVIIEGIPVARDRKILLDILRDVNVGNSLGNIFNVPSIASELDLVPRVDGDAKEVGVVVAEVVKKTPLTRKVIEVVPVLNGVPEVSEDMVYVAVVDRYRGKFIGRGFAKGIDIKSGAVAQTIGHDTHNVVVVGKNPGDMFKAFSVLKEVGGGIVAVDRGDTVCVVELSEAGLMSFKKFEDVYIDVKCLDKFFSYADGLSMMNIFYISLLPLPVIPEVRVTPKGVVDVIEKKILNPIAFLR